MSVLYVGVYVIWRTFSFEGWALNAICVQYTFIPVGSLIPKEPMETEEALVRIVHLEPE